MTHVLVVLLQLWKRRFLIITPLILFPIIGLAWSLSHNDIYEATTTLSLDQSTTTSPLLRDISNPDSTAILDRLLHGDNVLKTSLEELGYLKGLSDQETKTFINRAHSHLELHILTDDRLRISYSDSDPEAAEQILETVTFNFIGDILAPERLRTDEMLSRLDNQIKQYTRLEQEKRNALKRLKGYIKDNPSLEDKHMKDLIALEFSIEKATAQRDIALGDYQQIFQQSQLLRGALDANSPNSIIRFVEPPTRVTPEKSFAQHVALIFKMILLALAFSFTVIIIRIITDKTLKTEDDVMHYLGLKVLGQMPNMGQLVIKDKHLSIGS